MSRRTIDIAFTRRRVAVFVDGCFWHACPEHATWPKSNADWWRRKLLANVRRDRETTRVLEEHGWVVVRLWEHVSLEDAVAQVITSLNREP